MRFHPVVWMGRFLRGARRVCPQDFFGGMLGWALGAVLVLGLAGSLHMVLQTLPVVLQVVLGAILLKPLMAWKALREAGASVLHAPDLPEARKMLSWHLVSRDTSQLSEPEVTGAAMESVAENLSDSLVAPLFWFVVGGLPMVALYRFCNTADAMWGYRTPELEFFGKWAARADDVLNWIPARLTGLLICGTFQSRRALEIMLQDASKTPSPNAGFPMAALAGLLQVQLRKRDTYLLGEAFPEPGREDLHRTLTFLHRVAWVAVLFIGGVACLMP